MDDKELLTIGQAVDRFKVSDRTIRRWVKQGKVKAYRKGARLLIDPEVQEIEIVDAVKADFQEVDKGDTPNLSTFDNVSTLSIAAVQQANRRTFRWQLVVMSMLLTVGVTAGLLVAGYKIIQQQEMQLESLSATVRVERDRTSRVEIEKDRLAAEVAELIRQQAKSEAEIKAEQKKLKWWSRFL